MRVLMVATAYLPSVGGVETHVREVAVRLRSRGIDIAIATTDPTGLLPSDEVIDGIRVRRVGAWPRGRDWRFAPGLHGLIRDERWDIVHVQGYHTFVAPLAMWAASLAKIPYVVTFHSGGHSSRARRAFRGGQLLALRPLLKRSQRLIAVSDFERRLFVRALRLGRERFEVIPNGAQLPTPRPLNPSGAKPLIVSLGRLERYKGHHRILDAMPHLLRCLLYTSPSPRDS